MNIRWSVFFYIVSTVAAQDSKCDFNQKVDVGKTYSIFSPGYPNNYTAGITCRWIADCPDGYNCRMDCSDIAIPQSTACMLDRLLVSKSGDPQLSGADTYCGRGSLTTVSTGQRISIGFIASQTSRGGRFMCSLTAQRAATVTQCSCGERRQNRIVGGEETGVNEYKMMVGIVELSILEIKCGGVIISNRYVLSAAHCVNNKRPNEIAIVVGEHDVTKGDSPATQAYKVININVHGQYNSNTYDNDIAIITTNQTMAYNDRVGPVCLPFKYERNSEDWLAGKTVTILGWGTEFIGGPKSKVLLKADVDVITRNSCLTYQPSLTSRQLCTLTPGKDACQDDSGGPVLYTDPTTGLLFSVGIISFGRSCASNEPGINSKVTALLNWIILNTPLATYCIK